MIKNIQIIIINILNVHLSKWYRARNQLILQLRYHSSEILIHGC